MRADMLLASLLLLAPSLAAEEAPPDAELLDFLADISQETGDRFESWLDHDQSDFDESGDDRDE